MLNDPSTFHISNAAYIFMYTLLARCLLLTQVHLFRGQKKNLNLKKKQRCVASLAPSAIVFLFLFCGLCNENQRGERAAVWAGLCAVIQGVLLSQSGIKAPVSDQPSCGEERPGQRFSEARVLDKGNRCFEKGRSVMTVLKRMLISAPDSMTHGGCQECGAC